MSERMGYAKIVMLNDVHAIQEREERAKTLNMIEALLAIEKQGNEREINTCYCVLFPGYFVAYGQTFTIRVRLPHNDYPVMRKVKLRSNEVDGEDELYCDNIPTDVRHMKDAMYEEIGTVLREATPLIKIKKGERFNSELMNRMLRRIYMDMNVDRGVGEVRACRINAVMTFIAKSDCEIMGNANALHILNETYLITLAADVPSVITDDDWRNKDGSVDTVTYIDGSIDRKVIWLTGVSAMWLAFVKDEEKANGKAHIIHSAN